MMRADVIVLFGPAADDDLGLSSGREPLSAQHLSAECAVEGLILAGFPRRSRIEPDRLNADTPEPFDLLVVEAPVFGLGGMPTLRQPYC